MACPYRRELRREKGFLFTKIIYTCKYYKWKYNRDDIESRYADTVCVKDQNDKFWADHKSSCRCPLYEYRGEL